MKTWDTISSIHSRSSHSTAKGGKKTLTPEEKKLQEFREKYPHLLQKNDGLLLFHVFLCIFLYLGLAVTAALVPQLWVKILIGPCIAFCGYALGHASVHHHTCHKNCADSYLSKKILDFIYTVLELEFVFDGGYNQRRFRRAHLHHHSQPLVPEDVEHLYVMKQWEKASKSTWTRILYFLDLAFIGAREDVVSLEYINENPSYKWNMKDYEQAMKEEYKHNVRRSAIMWSICAMLLQVAPVVVWGFLYPMILGKNVFSVLGRFQHFDESLLDPKLSKHAKTLSIPCPTWLNYLSCGEITSHYVHHLFPDMPYYHLWRAHLEIIKDPEMEKMFVFH